MLDYRERIGYSIRSSVFAVNIMLIEKVEFEQ